MREANLSSEISSLKLINNIWAFFTKHINFETEKALCEMVYKKTGVEVKNLEEIHRKIKIDPDYEIPRSRSKLCYKKNFFVKAPFIKFERKESAIPLAEQEKSI